MSNITIQGFSPLQRELADRIWAMDTEDQVTEFITALPGDLQQQAWTVMQMIIAAELDTYMEVTEDVHSLIQTIGRC